VRKKPAGIPIIAAIALAVASLAGAAAQARAATSAPAQVPPQPEVSTSNYIDAQPSSNLLGELAVDGIDQANQDCVTYQGQNIQVVASSVFLDFGAQDVTGQGTWSTAGVIGGPNTPYYSNAWIEQAVESYAEAYDNAAESCYTNNNDQETIGTQIAYGTSNSGDTPTSTQTVQQADNWSTIGADAVNAISSFLATNNMSGWDVASVGPGDDIEPGFSEPASTVLAWVGEASTDINNEFGVNTLVDYGSADNCQTSDLTSASPCANNWTTGDIGQVEEQAYLAPEIYSSNDAQQWAAFCVYADQNAGYDPFGGSTVLSAPSAYISTAESWNDFNSDLEATGNNDCDYFQPSYETTMDTDITT
jgi:hypothetical protein